MKGSRRDREGEADDAGDPFVEGVFQFGLFGLNKGFGDAAGNEFRAAAPCEVAVEIEVPIILEIFDLVGGPGVGHADQALGDVALSVVVELMQLALQADVYRGDDLFDRGEAVGAGAARVARAINDCRGWRSPPPAGLLEFAGRRRGRFFCPSSMNGRGVRPQKSSTGFTGGAVERVQGDVNCRRGRARTRARGRR